MGDRSGKDLDIGRTPPGGLEGDPSLVGGPRSSGETFFGRHQRLQGSPAGLQHTQVIRGFYRLHQYA